MKRLFLYLFALILIHTKTLSMDALQEYTVHGAKDTTPQDLSSFPANDFSVSTKIIITGSLALAGTYLLKNPQFTKDLIASLVVPTLLAAGFFWHDAHTATFTKISTSILVLYFVIGMGVGCHILKTCLPNTLKRGPIGYGLTMTETIFFFSFADLFPSE